MPASHIFLILLQKRLHIDVDQTMNNSANIWNFQKKGLLPTDLYTGSEKVPKIFGTFRNVLYLCNVKMNVLAIRVTFPRGASLYRHYPFKSCFGNSFSFYIASHEYPIVILT